MRAAFFFLLWVIPGMRLMADGKENERAFWEARFNQVRIGMRRAEVERLLPLYVAPPNEAETSPYNIYSVNMAGGGQSILYYVSPGWQVTIFHDYTGVPRDAAGNATDPKSPENRVIELGKLEYRPAIHKVSNAKRTQ